MSDTLPPLPEPAYMTPMEGVLFNAVQMRHYAAAALAQREPLTDEQMRELVKDCGLDWHRGYAPLFAGDETNRYAVLIEEVQRSHGITKEQP